MLITYFCIKLVFFNLVIEPLIFERIHQCKTCDLITFIINALISFKGSYGHIFHHILPEMTYTHTAHTTDFTKYRYHKLALTVNQNLYINT